MTAQSNILEPGDREVTAISHTKFRPYDRYGTPNPSMDWVPLNGNANEGFESFLLKMKPGAQSTPHVHTGGEEFYIIDGTFTDCDGETFSAGDYVAYRPGSRHFSTSTDGCTLLVILRGQNESIQDLL